MLFGYPIAATAENWLHECLVEMLATIHTNLDAGLPPVAWPSIIPEAHRDELKTRVGLRERLDTYSIAVAAVTPDERQQIATCILQQNRIKELCGCSEDCEVLGQLPGASRVPIRELFEYAFDLLAKIGVRDRHYQIIYTTTRARVCPFCGCECFDALDGPREDLDHYLPKSRYPCAAANLYNLVPMGIKCNERYKLAQDILRGDDEARRPAFNPYEDREVGIILENSVPYGGPDGVTPRWQIDFTPQSPECETWDSVFHFRARVTSNVLDPCFKSWLNGLRAWCRSAEIKASDDQAIVKAIARYAEFLRECGYEDRSFLKAAVFELIHRWCSAGDMRLLAIMRDLVAVEGAA